MSFKRISHVMMGMDYSHRILGEKRLVSSDDKEGQYQFRDLVNYRGYELRTDERGKELIDSYDVKDLINYLESVSHKGLFERLQQEGLIKNIEDFDELWQWAGMEGMNCIKEYLTMIDNSHTKTGKTRSSRNLAMVVRAMRMQGHRPENLAKLLKV